ncbi:hypothetical protein C8J57DRAFT_1519661 [Mycena rebaudengoi]|nr:hypothetical protein C8J57DRAFT_1519661 [Mycena rebaudengoi]
MQFTIASLQAFIITGVMLQLAASTPIGMGMDKAGTDTEDGHMQLLWLSATKSAKRATMIEDSLLYAKSGKRHPPEDAETRA